MLFCLVFVSFLSLTQFFSSFFFFRQIDLYVLVVEYLIYALKNCPARCSHARVFIFCAFFNDFYSLAIGVRTLDDGEQIE